MSTIAPPLPAQLTGTVAASPRVRGAALASGAAAAVATTAVAAVADAAGIPLSIDGEAIPLFGFAELSLIGAVLGGLIAAACNRYSVQPRRMFLRSTVVLTALSCIPSVAFPPDVATKAILVLTHVVAALVVVPVLAARTRH